MDRKSMVKIKVNNFKGMISMPDVYNEQLSHINCEPSELIKRALESIKSRYGVHINFHDKSGISRINPQIEKILTPYLYHNNPFCNFVKRNNNFFHECVNQKYKLYSACCEKIKPFYGRCYTGIEEFVFPIWCDQKLIAIFCVGLFSVDFEKTMKTIRRNAAAMGADPSQCIKVYQDVVKKVDIPVVEMSNDMLLICDCISNLYRNYLIIENASSSGITHNDYIIDTTVDFIRNNYKRNLTLKLLATNCHCNPSYLSHIFKEKTKIGIIDFIHNIRIENAKAMLDYSNYSITDIANYIGYDDSGYFTRVFKRLIGLTPTAYRIRNS